MSYQGYANRISWGCRIHWLILWSGVTPTTVSVLIYDTKQSDVEASVMLELWGMQSTHSLSTLAQIFFQDFSLIIVTTDPVSNCNFIFISWQNKFSLWGCFVRQLANLLFPFCIYSVNILFIFPSFFFFFFFGFATSTLMSRGCPRGIMVKAMDCGIVVSEFVLQSRYYVHFQANTLGEGMNPLILPAMG